MRRKTKYIVYGGLLLTAVLVIAEIFKQWQVKKENNKKLKRNDVDKRKVVNKAILGLGIGMGLGQVFYRYHLRRERKKYFNAANYINTILTKENLKRDSHRFKKVVNKRRQIKNWITQTYGQDLVNGSPEDCGSFTKRTAISSNYDLDIVLPFKKERFSTLEEMFEHVYHHLEKDFGRWAMVRKQSSAIKVVFDPKRSPISFDIVPGKEIKDYTIKKDLNLHVRPRWPWQKNRFLKTNVAVQKQLTVNKPEARRVIKLIKVYRDKNQLPIPTIIIEQGVVKAMNQNGVHPSVVFNFKECLRFLAEEIEQKKLIDAANCTNNLCDKVNLLDRKIIAGQLKSDVKNMHFDYRYIKELFEC